MLHGAATGLLLATLLASAAAQASGKHDHDHDHHDHADGERRQGEVHVHGLGTLNLVLEGETLVVELQGPAANFVGFERAPRTAVETAAVERTLELLAQPGELLGLPAAAACRTQDMQVRGMDPVGHDDHAGHDHGHDHQHGQHDHSGDGSAQGHEGHAEMGATWEFLCSNPAALTAIEVKVFAVFPLTEELTANIIAPGLQTRQVLTPARSTLNLRR
jgi:ABC-type Zn2+ transport system substrate-binding protein/surface adhesin